MKRILLFSAALLALATLFSCHKQQNTYNVGIREFTGGIEQPLAPGEEATKTSIDETTITWNEGDEITVTDKNGQKGVYAAESGGASTTFVYKSGDEVATPPFTATYGDISQQEYSADGANCPLEAKSDNTNFQFRSPYAIVRVNAGTKSGTKTVKSVTVAGITLDCGKDGVKLDSTPKYFYVAIPSDEYPQLTVSFTADDGTVAVKKRTSEKTLAANTLLCLPDFQFTDGDWKGLITLSYEWKLDAENRDSYKDLFGGTAGVVSKAEGFGQLKDGTYMRVPSTDGQGGEIRYYQIDKSAMEPTSGNPKRIVGATGDPYITGGWPGDYWLIYASNGIIYPAGTEITVKYLTRGSGTAHKYHILECWDGSAWQPATPLQTETETGKGEQYNFIQDTANQEVSVSWKLVVPCSEMQFRMRCSANWQLNGKGAIANPNGGTCRISERCEMMIVPEK